MASASAVNHRAVIFWLMSVCLVVYLMIIVGGATRLTQSGLSMVDWQPVAGIIPPITESEWAEEFNAYKQYPEYQKINKGMSLDEFKSIFYWEYGHRVLGRFIGVLFFVPFVYFLIRRQVDSRYVPRLWVALVLGGLQGLMGWYMVKSGLVDVPRVSHLRLSAHLFLALLILVYLIWLILDIQGTGRVRADSRLRTMVMVTAGLLGLQILYGAFTAGLKAGHGFNTWPLMHGQFLAEAAVMMQPFWHNFVENGVMTQFIHRWVGAALVLAVAYTTWLALQADQVKVEVLALAALTLVQFMLGVATLLMNVPVVLGSLHQAVAALMVIVATLLVYKTMPEKQQ